jgi:tRNA A37 threonylcarbamoyladenosine dehydratase
MGTGNKLDPSRFEITDISKTSVCPLARVMRRELKARGIYHLKVVYSKEEPRGAYQLGENGHGKRVPASISFVPGAAGLVIAGEIIRELAGVSL